MKNLKELSDIELILAIFKCDKEMANLLILNIDHYPGAIMGYGDYYVEKFLLLNELLKRKNESNNKIV